MRICKQCGAEKDDSGFYARPNQPCRECHKGNARANRMARLGEARAYDRMRGTAPHRIAARKAYAQTPSGRERASAAKRRYAKRKEQERAAHVALGNAVRDGRVEKKPCVACGEAEMVQGHHFDYSRPLDVVWLCVHHHSAFHKIEREIQRMESKAA